LWSSWRHDGEAVAAQLNGDIELEGPDQFRRDVPHLVAGQIDKAKLLFVNINPGWDEVRNARVEAVVSKSEEDAWEFASNLFTRYPTDVGRMSWWIQMLSLAWRIAEEGRPPGAAEKRLWGNSNVAGWELFPLHSTNAGFLSRLDEGEAGLSLARSMQHSLELAIRLSAKATIVNSKEGARLVSEFATREGWEHIDILSGELPPGTAAYNVRGRLLLSVPRPLVSKFSGVNFDAVAAAIRGLMAEVGSA
jgi:hypothetical protein